MLQRWHEQGNGGLRNPRDGSEVCLGKWGGQKKKKKPTTSLWRRQLNEVLKETRASSVCTLVSPFGNVCVPISNCPADDHSVSRDEKAILGSLLCPLFKFSLLCLTFYFTLFYFEGKMYSSEPWAHWVKDAVIFFFFKQSINQASINIPNCTLPRNCFL